MNRNYILELLHNELGLYPKRVLKQHWSNGNWSYIESPRPDSAIMLLLNGNIKFISDNVTISAKSGDLIFLPQNSRYKAVFYGENNSINDYLVNFDISIEFPTDSSPCLLFENATKQCYELFEELIKEQFSDICSNLRTKGLFYLLLDAVCSMKNNEDSISHSLLVKAQNLLMSNIEISIPEVAHACCISESSLRRLFLDHLGISPVKYRLQSKLNQAIHLLDSSNMSINKIAASLNFYDTAYFCKVFRSYFGITPSQYLKNRKL